MNNGVVNSGAVPVVNIPTRGDARRGAWLRNTGIPTRLPVSSPPHLGQSLVPPAPTVSALTKCYSCGLQGYRTMTPAMASMVPGGCTEVDAALCVPPDTTGTTGGTQTNWTDGPTRIEVMVYEPNELKPYSGGVPVVISVYKYTATAAPATQVVTGTTGPDGKFVWQGSAPSPNKDYHFRVLVKAPGNEKTLDVPARLQTVMAAGNAQVSVSAATVVACPPGIDTFVCAVAQAQLDWKAIYDGQILAWGDSPQAQSFAADMAHANVPLEHPKLKADWPTYSWWVGDRGIPPKDWPDLDREFHRTWNLFAAIPFPQWPEIEDLFLRCCKGVPIGQGKDNARYGVVSPRLYSKTWSAYFPRTDKQILKDMAAAYLMGLGPIFKCMEHRIKQKVKETEGTIRTMAILSYATILVNLPWLIAGGAGGVAAFATETYDFIQLMGQDNAMGYGTSAVIAAAALAAGDPALVVAALEPIINELLGNVDPLTAAAIRAIYPQVVSLAVSAVASIASTSVQQGSNVVANGAAGFLDLAVIGQAIAVMAVKAIAAIPKMYAAEKISETEDAIGSMNIAAGDVLNYVAGQEVSPTFKGFLVWVVEALGLLELFDQAIDQFLDQFQDALEAGDAQGGGVTVVPEQDGGGPAVTPTDPAGVPTDVNGNPLPGGEAPLTPPSGGAAAPGSPVPEMPPMPTTATTSGIGGVGGTNPLTVVGVGGAAALLLVAGTVLS